MQPRRFSPKLALTALALVPFLTGGFSCSPEVKKFGTTSVTPTPASSAADTNNFTINFAVRSTSTEDDLEIQGGTASAAAIAGGCGATGAQCVCDFFTDSSGSGQVTSAVGATVYYTSGNFLRCTIPAGSTPANYTYARVRDRSNLRFSNIVEITNQDDADTTKRLTLSKILGDLALNEVRKISEYRCYINYLRKTGTTTTSFDCSSNPLSLVQVPYHFYLYADNVANNYGSQMPDILHSSGSGTLCAALMKFIDCTTAEDGASNPNALTLKFGLYARNTGAFTVPVQLTNAPARMSGYISTYGYAAKYDTTTSSCPPGLEARTIYQQTPIAVSDSSLNSTLTDSRVAELGNSSLYMDVDEFSGGTCNGTSCTPPSMNRDSVTPTNLQHNLYTAVASGTNTTFCVLPSSLLSGI